ncbi:hypothetical protein OZK63_42310, partial [Streptomyces sp. UMAF16]|nr:hypothetical protein [Streptomyces sp. UMAF16]
ATNLGISEKGNAINTINASQSTVKIRRCNKTRIRRKCLHLCSKNKAYKNFAVTIAAKGNATKI